VSDVFVEESRETTERELRQLSIACNAVLDGLWIEGGIIPDEFLVNELVETAIRSFSALIGVALGHYVSIECNH